MRLQVRTPIPNPDGGVQRSWEGLSNEYVCVCTCVCAHVCMFVNMCVHVCAYVCAHMCVCSSCHPPPPPTPQPPPWGA